MDNKIKIGIPRGLYYYKYNILWKEFFKELGCDIIVSPETNFEILENGKKYSASEMCLSLKIYIGHVFYLKDKVDYVLVPRIVCEKINSESCTNFIALYDIINNTFDVNILNYNVDERKRKTEESAFIKMGEKLGFGRRARTCGVLDEHQHTIKQKKKNINKIK
jgi:predicted nucleotide-binding protein (sugar kinase/HSP70/actin superfamily)